MIKLLAQLTLARVLAWVAIMLLLVFTDHQLFGVYDYYTAKTALFRFIFATLISACAVMLGVRRLQ
jgi:hypothetical protein